MKQIFAADIYAANLFAAGIYRGVGVTATAGHVGPVIRRRTRPAVAKVQTAKLFLYAHGPKPRAGAHPRLAPIWLVAKRSLKVRPRAGAVAAVRTQFPLLGSGQPIVTARACAAIRTQTVETTPFGSKADRKKALRILDEALLLNR